MVSLQQVLGDALIAPMFRFRRRIAACTLVVDTDLMVHTEPAVWCQVISNLVANATQHGSPNTSISITIEGRKQDAVVFTIHNRGMIPPSLMPRLFDPFRGTQHPRADSRGLGLGLFIAKQLIRAHDGTISVVSTEEAGTDFTLRLPRQPTRTNQ